MDMNHLAEASEAACTPAQKPSTTYRPRPQQMCEELWTLPNTGIACAIELMRQTSEGRWTGSDHFLPRVVEVLRRNRASASPRFGKKASEL